MSDNAGAPSEWARKQAKGLVDRVLASGGVGFYQQAVDAFARALDAARAEGIYPGDRIAVSVALIREIAALPLHHSEVCEVVKITPEPGGTKLLWLQRLDARGDRT